MKKTISILIISLSVLNSCIISGGEDVYYDCDGSSCYTSSDGYYSSKSACEDDCGGGSNSYGYNCNSGSCEYTSSGATYSTYSECNTYCGSSSGNSGYNCNSGTCVYVSSGATYATLSACENACSLGVGDLVDVVFVQGQKLTSVCENTPIYVTIYEGSNIKGSGYIDPSGSAYQGTNSSTPPYCNSNNTFLVTNMKIGTVYRIKWECVKILGGSQYIKDDDFVLNSSSLAITSDGCVRYPIY